MIQTQRFFVYQIPFPLSEEKNLFPLHRDEFFSDEEKYLTLSSDFHICGALGTIHVLRQNHSIYSMNPNFVASEDELFSLAGYEIGLPEALLQ